MYRLIILANKNYHVIYYNAAYYCKIERKSLTILQECVQHVFEDDTFLCTGYGDYMQLPLVEKRCVVNKVVKLDM